jgi:hypothetical protein
MEQALTTLVWQRAHATCEYCQLPQSLSPIPFEIDHIIAQKHGGATDATNLALACFYCNSFQGAEHRRDRPGHRADRSSLPMDARATSQSRSSHRPPSRPGPGTGMGRRPEYSRGRRPCPAQTVGALTGQPGRVASPARRFLLRRIRARDPRETLALMRNASPLSVVDYGPRAQRNPMVDP